MLSHFILFQSQHFLMFVNILHLDIMSNKRAFFVLTGFDKNIHNMLRFLTFIEYTSRFELGHVSFCSPINQYTCSKSTVRIPLDSPKLFILCDNGIACSRLHICEQYDGLSTFCMLSQLQSSMYHTSGSLIIDRNNILHVSINNSSTVRPTGMLLQCVPQTFCFWSFLDTLRGSIWMHFVHRP